MSSQQGQQFLYGYNNSGSGSNANANNMNQQQQQSQSQNGNMNVNSSGSASTNTMQQQNPTEPTIKTENGTQPSTTPMTMSNAQQQQQQSKELNAASLCRYGQETVQEIVSRTQELYQTLRSVQPPLPLQNTASAAAAAAAADRKPKFQETLRNIRALFKRVRIIYDKIGEGFADSEDVDLEDLIPFKKKPVAGSGAGDNNENGSGDCDEQMMNEKLDSEGYRLASEEYREVVEQLVFKNKHLSETMDLMRHIIWDINTMLAMRKE